MSKKLTPHSANQVVSEIAGLGITHAVGSSVPSDGAKGYAPGCIFCNSAASTVNTMLYVNINTNASCNFDPLKG